MTVFDFKTRYTELQQEEAAKREREKIIKDKAQALSKSLRDDFSEFSAGRKPICNAIVDPYGDVVISKGSEGVTIKVLDDEKFDVSGSAMGQTTLSKRDLIDLLLKFVG